nr:tetratricopeptide repeat protein [Candidatus Sigynarchaeota archaeon]
MKPDILEFEEKLESLPEHDKGMALLNYGDQLLGQSVDPTVPAFRALHIFENSSNDDGYIQACILIANYLFKKEEFQHALNYLVLAEKKFGHHENAKLKAYVLNKIGFMHFHLNQYPESIEKFTTCIELLEEMGDLNETSKIYGTLGLIYQDTGDRDRGNYMFAEAARIARMAGNHKEAEKYTTFII